MLQAISRSPLTTRERVEQPIAPKQSPPPATKTLFPQTPTKASTLNVTANDRRRASASASPTPSPTPSPTSTPTPSAPTTPAPASTSAPVEQTVTPSSPAQTVTVTPAPIATDAFTSTPQVQAQPTYAQPSYSESSGSSGSPPTQLAPVQRTDAGPSTREPPIADEPPPESASHEALEPAAATANSHAHLWWWILGGLAVTGAAGFGLWKWRGAAQPLRGWDY